MNERILAIHFQNSPDKNSLCELAHFLLKFTPVIGIRPPDLLYLNITTTLQLFGGEEKIVSSIYKFLQSKSLSVKLALADDVATSGAVALFSPSPVLIVPKDEGEKALASFSTQALTFLVNPLSPPSEEQLKSAQQTLHVLSLLGIRTLGKFAKLPAAAISPRFGQFGVELHRRARAVSSLLINPFVPTATYREGHSFDFPVVHVEALLFVAKTLLQKLEERLRGDLSTASELILHLESENSEEMEIRVSLLRPLKKEKSLLPILKEKLSSLSLTSPLLSFSIELALPIKDRGGQFHLFDSREENSERLDELLGRLVAGVGPQFISAAVLRERHRPEKSWEPTLFHPFNSQLKENTLTLPTRPTILLSSPEPLKNPKEIVRMEGPERLVGEWWDGTSHERDYFLAETQSGQLLWIFTSPKAKEGEWFLHGYFD